MDEWISRRLLYDGAIIVQITSKENHDRNMGWGLPVLDAGKLSVKLYYFGD